VVVLDNLSTGFQQAVRDTPIEDLAGFRVYAGTDASALVLRAQLRDVGPGRRDLVFLGHGLQRLRSGKRALEHAQQADPL